MHIPTKTFLLPALLPCLLTALPAQQTTEDPVTQTRATLEKWVETRGLVSKEQRDWTLGKESLAARMDVIRREIESLQKRIGEAEGNIAEADKKRAELLAENERRKTTTDAMLEYVTGLEARALKMLPRLPDPLRERVKVLSQRLPTAGEVTKQSLSERWMNVIGILNDVNKWNREITVTSEVRALADGTSVEVAVLYVGVGQGYYAANNGKVAGIGTATAEGWQWKPANELAPLILQTIGIWKNEQVAAFVRLPVQIL